MMINMTNRKFQRKKEKKIMSMNPSNMTKVCSRVEYGPLEMASGFSAEASLCQLASTILSTIGISSSGVGKSP